MSQLPVEVADQPVANADLPPAVAAMNRLYLQRINERGLLSAAAATGWRQQTVRVFLRHDADRVFAVMLGDGVAMADYVRLANARYHVDQTGRRQTLANQGVLPNGKTIHAWLTGRLVSAADSGRLPATGQWKPVSYNPARGSQFCCVESQRPIWSSVSAWLVPGAIKVWCDRASADRSVAVVSGEGR